jgi:hypothetical protein
MYCYGMNSNSSRCNLPLMAIEPSLVADREAREPLKPPMGVRATAEI